MVPKGWELKELQTIISGSIKNGFSPVASDSETGYWVLGLGALSDDGIKVDEIKPVEPTKRVIEAVLSKGDFLVSRSNTPDKVGRSIQYRGEINNCSYPDLMMKFRVDENQVDPLFIEQQLKSSVVRSYFKMCASGSSKSMVKINKKTLEKTPLLIPSFPEQQKIANILSTWDKAISTTECLIDNSTQQKKALMQQLLTGKKRLLDDEGKRFEGEWEEVKLGKVSEMNSGGTPKSTIPEYYDGDIPWVSIADMTKYGKWISTTAKYLTDSGLANSSARLYPKGTVLYAMYASIGECSIAQVAVSSSQAILGIRTKEKLNNLYLYYYLSNMKSKILLMGQQGTQSNLNAGMVKSFQMQLPSLKEQQKIAAVLTSADNEIELLEQQLAHLQQEKKALMQQLLTGKKRVVVDG